jgi:hypothetical protein
VTLSMTEAALGASIAIIDMHSLVPESTGRRQGPVAIHAGDGAFSAGGQDANLDESGDE